MPSDIILSNVVHFLEKFQPFNFLSEADLKGFCQGLKIKYFEEGEVVFEEGKSPEKDFFIVQKGAVQLIQQNNNGEEVLVDMVGEGDIIGLRAFLAKGPYATTCKAKEDVLIYLCPFQQMLPLLEAYPQLALFIATHFAAKISERAQKLQGLSAIQNHDFPVKTKPESGWEDFQIINSKKEVITCSSTATIKEAALLMNEHEIGSLVVTDLLKNPIGIITDADFRRKVIAGNLEVNLEKVTACMSNPVVTINENPTVSQLVLAMSRHKIRHFVVTQDGTDQSPIKGIISERDIVVALGNNPLALIKEIQKATAVATLKQARNKVEQLLKNYLKQEISISFLADFITEVNDELIHKAIAMAQSDLAENSFSAPEVDFCWLSLGSEGRKEQLLRTDLDNALLFANPKEEKEIDAYFLELGKKVNDILMACGFEKCPGEIMASNPKWCTSLKQWKTYFNKWILEPDPKALMHANIFFDFRVIYGKKTLAEDLKSHIFSLMNMVQAFLNFFAKNALINPPPLSLFRNFVVEKKGEHIHDFDIKARAMMPISDGARVLAYSHGIKEASSTLERLEAIGQLEKHQDNLFVELKMAYGTLMSLRTLQGLEKHNSGRYIDISGLNKLQRQGLKNIFKTISEFQTLIGVRFQTDFIR